MDIKIKSFIEDNINLIETNQWEEVYKKAINELKDTTGEFTELMLQANIHPESYLDYLPSNFLSRATISNFEIPNNIKSIGWEAFSDCENLEDVTIPDSIEFIDMAAFYNCKSLISIKIPDNVIEISERAFFNCTSLKSISIPNNVETIGQDAFYECSNLTSIVIPDSITAIGEDAFSECGDNLVINYTGTKAQWNKIYNRYSFMSTCFTVNCTDGKIVNKR